jgi:hypothetical protein
MSKTKPVRPSSESAKVCHGFCGYGDVAFNLNSHVVAVAEKKLFHILDCVGRVPHVRSPNRWKPQFRDIEGQKRFGW